MEAQAPRKILGMQFRPSYLQLAPFWEPHGCRGYAHIARQALCGLNVCSLQCPNCEVSLLLG